MKLERNDYWLIGIAAILAVVAAMIAFPDSLIGVAVNTVIDTFVVLTTSEETRLSQLEPETQSKARELIQRLANKGIAVHVGQTLRTNAQEQAAIASGHSGVKTNSWHESGRAVDMYPVDPDSLQPDTNGTNDALFIQMQQEAEAVGFHQIAYDENWNRKYITNAQGKKIWDGGHMEWHGGFASATDALNAYLG